MIKFFENVEIYGTGSTSAGAALEVKNSGATSLLRMRNDGVNIVGANGNIDTYWWTTNSASQQLGFTNEAALAGIYSTNPNLFFTNGGSGGNTFVKTTTTNGNWVFGSPGTNIYSMNISDSKMTIQGSGASSVGNVLKIINSADTSLMTVRNDGFIGVNLTGSPTAQLHINRNNDGQHLLKLTSDGYDILTSRLGGFDTTAVVHTFDGIGGGTYTFIADTNPYLIWNLRSLGETLRIGGSIPTITTTRPTFVIDAPLVGIGETYPNVTAKLQVKGADSGSTNYTLKLVNSADTVLMSVRNDGKVLIQTLTAGLGGGNVSTNTAFGTDALASNTTGFQNTAVGNLSLFTNTTASGNTGFGHGALYLNGGSGGGFDNTAIGNEAMVLNNTSTANFNTAVGSGALRANTSGWENTAIGYKAGNNTDIPFGNNSIGRFNTWVGTKACGVGNSGDDVYSTTVIGYSGNARGNNSIVVGANSVVYSATSIVIGASSSVIGTNSIALGSNVSVSADNTMVLGNGVNVGVGTNTPTQRLEVSGNTKLTSLSNEYQIGSYTVLKISQGAGAPNISLGNNNTLVDADNGGAVVIGSSSLAASDGIAIGLNTSAYTNTVDAIAIGRSATVSNGSIRGVAIGREASVTASNAFAIGNYTTASQDDTIILGNNSLGNKPNIGISVSTPTAKLDISGATGYNQLRVRTSYTPTSTADANGNTGDLAWDDSFFYVKTSGGWKRSTLNTF